MKFVLFLCSTVLYAGLVDADDRCGLNAGPSACGPACESTCDNPHPTVCPRYCIQNGCRCNDGYLRDGKTGKCVRSEDCSLPNE